MEGGFRVGRGSNEMPEHWSAEDLLRSLRRRPAALEPGLRFLDEPLIYAPELRVELCGEDLLGRPVMVLPVESQDGSLCDRLLALVAKQRSQQHRFSAWFSRPGEPRALLIGEHYSSHLLDRLELLRAAVPVRSYLVEVGGSEEEPEPVFRLHAEGIAEDWAGGRPRPPPTQQRLARRLVHAADAIHPPVQIVGDAWPLLLAGRHGLFASLHRAGEGLQLAWLGEGRQRQVLELLDDAAVDLAIDVLLRVQSDPIAVQVEA